MEELGRTLFPSTYLESWMAVIALLGADADESTTLLRAIASGEAHAAFVWPGDDATWDVDSVPVATVDEEAATGSFSYIPRPSAGAILVVPAQRGAETGLAVVESGSSGDALRATDLVTPDLCRPLVALDLKRAPARFLALTRAPETLTRTIAMGATILAAEMVGAADGALTSSVDYAKARHQFGRPIATFQALKHRMADTLVAVEGARASTFRAASHADDDLSELVHYARIAKTNAGAALYTAAKDCIQIHGGMGFTWDDLSHLFLKKHFSAANLLGASDRLRALIFEYERAAHANA
jgi:alkylation response protein AidB-like acyl-CoA dehydrogenase